MPTLSERINEAPRTLRASTPDTIGFLVVSTEGFVVSSLLPAELGLLVTREAKLGLIFLELRRVLGDLGKAM